MVNCKICKKEFKNNKSMSIHIRFTHKEYTSKTYYDEFLKKQNEETCRLDGCMKETSFNRLGSGYLDYCCQSHATKDKRTQEKIKKTIIKKTGSLKNHYKSTNIKIKETKKLKYGDENYNNKHKIKTSLLNRPNHEKEIWKDSVRKNWNEKPKDEIDKIVTSRKNTLNALGIDLNKLCKEAIKKKYGVDNISQTENWKEKVKKFWSDLSDNELSLIVEKRKQAMLKKYRVEHNMHVDDIKERVIAKGRETKIKNNYWLPDDKINEFSLYKRHVSKYTLRSKRKKYTKQQLQKIGKCGISDALQIDHRFSIKEGFLQNIDPKIIGHQCNLQMIPWEDNDKKKSNCSITKEELLYKYDNNIID